MWLAAVDEVDLVDSLIDRIGRGFDLGDHAAGDSAIGDQVVRLVASDGRDEAIRLADQIKIEASQDILLRPHASEIRRQALLYVFEVQARLTRQPQSLTEFCEANNVGFTDIALEEVEQNMSQQGLLLTKTGEGENTILQI